MQIASQVEVADRLSRRRARLLPVLGILFIAGQPLYFANSGDHAAQVKTIAWLVWAAVLLLALAFAGGGFRGAAVRALVEDEVARLNRLRGYAAGFWAASLATIGLYAYSLIDQVKGREALHIVLTVAIAAALIRFGTLERRALRDG
jgi:MFS family permease